MIEIIFNVNNSMDVDESAAHTCSGLCIPQTHLVYCVAMLLTLGACASEGYSSWVSVCLCVPPGKTSFYVRLYQSLIVATVYI